MADAPLRLETVVCGRMTSELVMVTESVAKSNVQRISLLKIPVTLVCRVASVCCKVVTLPSTLVTLVDNPFAAVVMASICVCALLLKVPM